LFIVTTTKEEKNVILASLMPLSSLQTKTEKQKKRMTAIDGILFFSSRRKK